MIPLVGFAPDIDPTTPGVLIDCKNLIPFEAGMLGAPTPVNYAAAPPTPTIKGIFWAKDITGLSWLISGTQTKLYELSGTSWIDRTRAVGGNYNVSTPDSWSFAQFANATLAANRNAPIQRRIAATAFADIAGAPSAKFIEVASGFAIALNTSSFDDEWYCSAYLDETNWTLSVSNQCVKGRLIGGQGPISAVKRFGDDLVAYKGTAMWVGTYVGAPEVWRWRQVSAEIGCSGQNAVVDTGAGHVFVGSDNIYLFDGTTPRSIANDAVRRWFSLNNVDNGALWNSRAKCMWDRAYRRVWIFFESSTPGAAIKALVWHMPTNRWGLWNGSYVVDAVIGQKSYDSEPCMFVNGYLASLNGACSSASFTTGDLGDDEGYRTCANLRVRYLSKPATSTATGYIKQAEGDAVSTGSSAAQADGRHNMRQTARWHRFKVDTTGDFTVTAIRPEFKEGGRR